MSDREHKVTLRDYVDTRFTSLEKATDSAKELMEKRLEGMNEIRESMREREAHYPTRQELSGTLEDVRMLRESRAELRGKASQNAMLITAILSAVAIAIGVVGLFR